MLFSMAKKILHAVLNILSTKAEDGGIEEVFLTDLTGKSSAWDFYLYSYGSLA